jgi:hypothetical protein
LRRNEPFGSLRAGCDAPRGSLKSIGRDNGGFRITISYSSLGYSFTLR